MHEVCQGGQQIRERKVELAHHPRLLAAARSAKADSAKREGELIYAAMRLYTILSIAVMLGTAGCHPGPVVHSGPNMDVGGTIAGIVSTTSNAPVPARKVTAINSSSGERYDATTGPNGGFTIKVPRGTYRLELQLLEGERVTKQPGDTKIDNSDLDPKRDFVITGGKS
jgi:hypothetical protein